MKIDMNDNTFIIIKETAMNDKNIPTTWPDLAISLYDRLTGRQAEIAYEFENFHLNVPHQVGNEALHATWTMNGTVKIRTRDLGA